VNEESGDYATIGVSMADLDPIALQRAFYDHTAQGYTDAHAQDVEHEYALGWLVSLIRHLKIGTVLDVGAGTGRVIFRLNEEVPSVNVIGVEPSQTMREEGVRRGLSPAVIVAGDALGLNYPDASFEMVSAFAVLHHVPRPSQAIEEMLRVSERAIFISDCNNFGAGSRRARSVKNLLRSAHLWHAADILKTRGRGYRVSEGDGISYSYSVFNDFALVSEHCAEVLLLTTSPTGPNPRRSAPFVALLGIK
jgi:ubiquinone/menaquinone biosynthesis C-methylase UbiE